jgi:lysine 2,3-aminomutase
MYCRHCTRKRKVGDVDFVPGKDQLTEGIRYIADSPQVRDVLLSGGDPLMLSDSKLDWLLSEIKRIPHVEIIRIGTRMPVVLPYRITDDLVKIMQQYHPIWINTHFNHPRELTASSREAITKLANGGFPLGNQSVLLADVNDCPRIMKSLVQKLVQNRIRPYYLYQCDLAEGLSHFRTPIGKGIEIMESLVGHTSGLARPTYVIDAPGGGGKIPVMPNYIISWSTHKVILRNYEGVITTYKEPDSYEPKLCDRNCDHCNLELDLTGHDESDAIGIEKLLSDTDVTISLYPEKNERMQRREEHGRQD